MIGIWHSNQEARNAFENLLTTMNSTTSLEWTVKGPTQMINFMDQTITIHPTTNEIHFKTYQKPMSLYQYIPPHSAHPAGVLKSLIFGRLRKYYLDNSNKKDLIYYMTLLIKRLLKQGYKRKILNTYFQEALVNIQQKQKQNNNNKKHTTEESNTNENEDVLYYHLPFHPRGIQRENIQQEYTTHLQKRLPHTLTVAISRPRNLKDRLCNSRLPYVLGNNPSNFLNNTGDN